MIIMRKMNSKQLRIVQKQISEIKEYREVLARLFKHRISLDQAITDWFEKGFHETQAYLHSYLVLINNHFYDSLRDDPRFKEIVKKENKKYQERLKKYGKY